jgi:hypothetical protein
MPTMPSGLDPVASSYSFGGPSGVMRTEVAGGAPRYGLDYERGVQSFNITMILDQDHLVTWTLFYHHVIKKGSVSFTMDLDSGMGYTPHNCNIVPGSYNANRLGPGYMSVSFVIEAEASVYAISYEDAVAFVEVTELLQPNPGTTIAAIEQFATVDSNVLDYQ